MPSRVPTRLVARVAVAIALLAAGWAVLLIVSGGVDLRLFGQPVSTHDPLRPILIAAVFFTIYMLAGGDAVAVRWALMPDRWLARTTAHGRLVVCRLVVGVLTAGVVVLGAIYGVKTAAGSDSYGYVSQAELWLSARHSVPQPWAQEVPWPESLATFTPLGYNSAMPPTFTLWGYTPSYDPWSIVPTYAPGFPLLMAGAKLIAGNAAMFWVVPICGGLLLLSTYGLGQRLGSPVMGVIAAFLVATSQPFLEYTFAPMTDIPAAAGWAIAWWAALGKSMRSAWVAGLALAVVIVVRPDRVPLGATIGLWLALCVWRDPLARRRHIARAVVILGGFGAGVLTVLVLFWHLYGSPFRSGYGSASGPFATTYFWTNLGLYAREFAKSQSPIGFLGVAALIVPLKVVWPKAPDGIVLTVLAVFSFFVWAEFCFVNGANAWVRFLLPSYAPIMVGVAAVLMATARAGGRGSWSLLAAFLVVFGSCGVEDALRMGLLRPDGAEASAIGVAERVRRETPDRSIVLTMQHSGNIRYYAGRLTLRWDQLPSDWLDKSLAWFAERDVHVYAVIDQWELPMVEAQFTGQRAAKKFKTPVFKMDNTNFFDLGIPDGTVITTEIMPRPPRHVFGLAPAPPPALIFHR